MVKYIKTKKEDFFELKYRCLLCHRTALQNDNLETLFVHVVESAIRSPPFWLYNLLVGENSRHFRLGM